METTYHVRLTSSYIGPGSPYALNNVTGPKLADRIEDAAIFSRQGAINVARIVGGTAVMFTRTGKVRNIYP